MSSNNYIVALIVGIVSITVYWIIYCGRKQLKHNKQISQSCCHQTEQRKSNEEKSSIETSETTEKTSKCEYCGEPLTHLNSESEEKKCYQCDKPICRRCGIIDPGIIECQAPYICRECIPIKCNECSRILIDENIWEEDIVCCDGCNKPFCNYNLSSNCCVEVVDDTGYERTECRDCIKKTKIKTDVCTLEKYKKYLKDNQLESKEFDFKKWVETQNDPSIKYEIKEYSMDIPSVNISSSECREDQIREKLMKSSSCMTREMILRMYETATRFGRSNPPLKCEFCHSSEKGRYFMLRTHFITWECIDCAVQHAIAN